MKIQKLIFAVFLLTGSLFGCSLNDAPPQAISYYTLDYEKPVFDAKSPLPIALTIEKFKTASPYNTNRIIYSTDEFSQNKYYYHQWMSPPDEMVSSLLTRDLIASNYFEAVLRSGDIILRHQLFGFIDQFYEKDTDNQWYAVLSITITLMNKNEKDATNQFCLQKNYKKTSPLDKKNPKSLARSMSQALSEISSLMIADIYQALDQNCADSDL